MDDEVFPEADRIEGAPHPRETVHLFGQDRAAESFLTALSSGRMHHGWLITGPRGVGKATLAWRIARFMLAGRMAPMGATADLLHMDPDDPVFRTVAALAEPRLTLIRRPYDVKDKRTKKAITVDEVRKLNGFFHLSAADGGWRVAIVDAADEMNTAAANALLKILEEPPEKTLLILISHQPGRLLPTIRSRCRTLACEKLSENDLSLALDGAGFTMPPEMTAIGELADGSAGDAIALVQAEGEELYADIIATFGTIPQMDRGRVLRMAEAAAGRGSEATYALTLKLVALALNRMAKAGATGATRPDAAKGEGEVFARLSPHADAGRKWAELSQVLSAKAAHAASVNLDPASVILDMFLQIEATAARAR